MQVYEISAQDRISFVSETWDQFARSNGGAGALASTIRGRPLWDFVQGLDARAYLNAIFFAVRRSNRPIKVRYRCDGVEDLRLYQMKVSPAEAGGLRLSHLPLSITSRPRKALPPGEHGRCCAQCLRAQLADGWRETDICWALATGPVDYVTCPQCRAEAKQAIEHLMSPSSLH